METVLMEKLNIFLNKYNNMKEIVNTTSKTINEFISSYLKPSDRVAIWGAGEHTQNLLKFINVDTLNVVCFIDKSNEKINTNINGRVVINPQNIESYSIDSIIISSYEFRSEIRQEVQELDLDIKIIDLYEKYDFGYPIFHKYLYSNATLYADAIASIYELVKSEEYFLDEKIEQEVQSVNREMRMDTKAYRNIKLTFDEEALKQIVKEKNFNKKVKVDFFVQFPQGWTSLESVWKSFNEDNRFSTRIIQVPFIHANRDNSNDDISQFLCNKNIPFISWYLYDIDVEKPDIVFYQNPYDSSRPYEFSTKEVIRKTRVAYIPYSLEIAGGVNIKMQFNLFLQNNAWLVFARSNRHKDMFKKYSSNKGENVTVVGHPKIDCIFNLPSFNIDKHMLKITEGKKVFFWNPHFGVKGDIGWSTFNKWQDKILDIFENKKEIFLIIRPHPLLLQAIKEDSEIIPGIVRFKDRIRKMNNVFFDTNFDYRHSFATSDALISDASSFLLEYLPTFKPILYLPNYDGPGLNDDGDIVEHLYVADKSEDIEKFVDMVIADLDYMKESRTSKIEEYLYSFDGKVGERIKEAVLNKYITETKG